MSARDAWSEALHGDPSATARTAIVLLHGLCSTPEELRAVETPLRSLGYAVEAPRIDGYAFDPAATVQTAAPWSSWIDAVERRVDALRRTHARVMLVGISAGATLALGTAIRCGTRVDALVLMSTPLRFDGWAISRLHALLPLALYTPLGRLWRYRECPPYGVKNERVRAWIARELQARRISRAGSAVIDIGHLREHDRLLRHVRARLDQVVCARALVLHARDDEVASVGNVAILARGLRCGSFRAVVLGNSFHMITIDNDRQEVVRATTEFAAALTHDTA